MGIAWRATPVAARHVSPCGGGAHVEPERQLPPTDQRAAILGPASDLVSEGEFGFTRFRMLAAIHRVHFCSNARRPPCANRRVCQVDQSVAIAEAIHWVGGRAQNLDRQGFRLTVRAGHLLLFREGRGGAGVSVGKSGDFSLFQVAGVARDGERLFAAAAGGATAPAVTTANLRCRPVLLDIGVPMVHHLARVTTDREA
jgi:hypothetical protein